MNDGREQCLTGLSATKCMCKVTDSASSFQWGSAVAILADVSLFERRGLLNRDACSWLGDAPDAKLAASPFRPTRPCSSLRKAAWNTRCSESAASTQVSIEKRCTAKQFARATRTRLMGPTVSASRGPGVISDASLRSKELMRTAAASEDSAQSEV